MVDKYIGKSVLFLDVDGVLNTSSTCVCAPSGVCIGWSANDLQIS